MCIHCGTHSATMCVHCGTHSATMCVHFGTHSATMCVHCGTHKHIHVLHQCELFLSNALCSNNKLPSVPYHLVIVFLLMNYSVA